LGIDYSRRFIETATMLQRDGALDYSRTDEGALTTRLTARVPVEVDRNRVRFETGDAMNLRSDIGVFDVVLMANLIDRLREPECCLSRLPEMVKSGGQLIITSPYTWLEDFTPAGNWLGGYERDGRRISTGEGLSEALAGSFELVTTKNLPFLIREHARKFQWSVAEATIWKRR
ncbi:MAG: putative 4-mercaptohistidine N1-methyltransferase, partial [Verrucomicrobiaceae bacterium]